MSLAKTWTTPPPDDLAQPVRYSVPPGLITLFAFAIAITPEFNFLGVPKVRITDLMLPVLLMAYLSNGSTRKRFPLTGIMLAILCWDWLCLFVFGQTESIRSGVFYLVKRAIYFLIAFLGFSAVSKADDFYKILKGLLLASPLLCLSVLYEMRMKGATDEFVENASALRASGIIAGQQASTGLFLVIIICLLMGVWPYVTPRTALIGGLIISFAALLATGTKGALISMAPALGLILLSSKRTAHVLTVLLALGLGWFFLPEALRGRLEGMRPEFESVIGALAGEGEMPTAGSSSLASRILTAEHTLNEVIPRSPAVGLGTGFLPLGCIDNFYLAEWVYHGFIGLVLFLILIFKMASYLLRAHRTLKFPVARGATLGTLAGLVALTVAGFHAESFYLIRPMEAYMLLFGLVAGYAQVELAPLVKRAFPGWHTKGRS